MLLIAVTCCVFICSCSDKKVSSNVSSQSEVSQNDTMSKQVAPPVKEPEKFTPEIKKILFNSKLTVGTIADFTITSKEWSEYLVTSTGVGDSDYDDIGDYFLIIRGKMKNKSNQPLSPRNTCDIKVTTNTDKEYIGSMLFESADNKRFNNTIKALEETEFIIYANIPWSEYHNCQTLQLDIDFITDAKNVNKGIYSDGSVPYTTYTMTFNR